MSAGRLLITGASGFVGRRCVEFASGAGYEVHAASRSGGVSSPQVRWHAADLFDEHATQTLLRTVAPAHLLHLAWYTEPGRYWESPLNLDWEAASLRLARAFAEHGGQCLAVAGTCAEYHWDGSRCSEASTPLDAASLYGVTKNALHATLAAFAQRAGLRFAWGRIFFAYGPGEAREKIVSKALTDLLAGRSVHVAQPKRRLDYVYVDDVARALVDVLPSNAGAVNIGTGEGVGMRELVSLAAARLGKEDALSFGSGQAQPDVIADAAKLKTLCPWFPSYSLDAGVAALVEHVREAALSAPGGA